MLPKKKQPRIFLVERAEKYTDVYVNKSYVTSSRYGGTPVEDIALSIAEGLGIDVETIKIRAYDPRFAVDVVEDFIPRGLLFDTYLHHCFYCLGIGND